MTAEPKPSDRGLVSSLPPTLNDVSVSFVAAMAELGIELTAHGRVTVDHGSNLARIGFVALLDVGGAVAAHCADATALQISEICRQAELALLDGPIGPQWRKIRAGWECSILEPSFDATLPSPRSWHAPRRSSAL